MNLIIRPGVFESYALERVSAGMSIRGRTPSPLANNMSWTVGDDPKLVRAARDRFAERLGFDPGNLATQLQVHGTEIVEVTSGYEPHESDGLVTTQPGHLLGISIADCAPILLADADQRVVMALHSGWRGTSKEIARHGVQRLQQEYGVDSQRLVAWIGPAAGACCYEVGDDVESRFDPEFSRSIGGGKYLFDNRAVILRSLRRAGLQPERIELDARCTICDRTFHSYRRDGQTSGRMLAAIGLKGPIEK